MSTRAAEISIMLQSDHTRMTNTAGQSETMPPHSSKQCFEVEQVGGEEPQNWPCR